jgi:nucleoside-diphosphate-sugar epimerase
MQARPIDPKDLTHILTHTRALWEQLRGQDLFITGGTGFFGCWLMESFCFINSTLHLQAKATVLTRSPSAFKRKLPHIAEDSAITLLQGDVRSFDFPDGEFAYIIHAATDANARQLAEQPQQMLSTILGGTERTLEFAVTHGTRKLLLTSSGAVYGRQPAIITHIPETYRGAPDPLDLSSIYAEGKRISELMCSLASQTSNLECKIARCYAFCGSHLPLDAHFAIGNFIGDVLAARPIRIMGDGTTVRSYLYAADLAIWLWTILFEAPSLVPINVGSSQDLSIGDLAHLVATTLGSPVPIHTARQAIPEAEISRYVPHIGRAESLLGLTQTVTLEDAIRRTAKWHGYEG